MGGDFSWEEWLACRRGAREGAAVGGVEGVATASVGVCCVRVAASAESRPAVAALEADCRVFLEEALAGEERSKASRIVFLY